MRPQIPLFVLLSPLFTVALPIGQLPQHFLSPSKNLGSSTGSTSSPPSTTSRLKSWIKSIPASIPARSPTFNCYSKATSQPISTLVTYLSELLQNYRDELLDKKSPQVPHFDACMGKYGAEPSGPLRAGIQFTEITKKQAGKLEKIFKAQLPGRYPDFEVKKEGNGMLLVEKEGPFASGWRSECVNDSPRRALQLSHPLTIPQH